MTTTVRAPATDQGIVSETARPPVREAPAGRWTSSVPTWWATLLGVMSAICAITAIIPPLARELDPVLNWLNIYTLPVQANLTAAVFYALLAGVVSVRKRAAWWVSVAWLVVAVLLNGWVALLVADVDRSLLRQLILGCVCPILVLAVLIPARREFPASVRPGALGRAAVVLVVGLLIGIAVAWALVPLGHGTLAPANYPGWAVDTVTGEWASTGVELTDPDSTSFDFLFFDGDASSFLNFLAGVLGALALIAAFITLFRSQTKVAELPAADEIKVRNLLAEYGSADSLGYFATRRDKLAIFAPNGRAAVSYRVQGGVSLASGDPLGDPAAWPQAISAWQTEAAGLGWPTAVMGASERGALAYNRAGLGAIQLGDEAILTPDGFDLAGRELKAVRQAVTRAEKAGVTVRVRRHRSLSAAELDTAVAVADAWRDTETERGFSMALGRLGDPNDAECLLVQAFDDDGRPVGLLSLSPWGSDGVSLDLMRRNPTAPNGTMELMVAELVRQGGQMGITRVSLNFAVFRSAFEEGARIGAGPVLRLWRQILLFFSRWWQLEALYRSNVKYNPEWFPRFVCFSDVHHLTRISLAAGMAEGYLTLPFSRFRQREQAASRPIALLPGVRPILGAPPAATPVPVTGRPQQVQVRFDKVAALRARGIDPYPVAIAPSSTVAALADRGTGSRVSLAGRLLLIRNHGGVIFARLRDWTGDVQLILQRDVLGVAEIRNFAAAVDLGDLVGVTGEVTTSRTGTRSVEVTSWRLTGKCLRPLPDKWRGLIDPESRVRARYVDLAINDDTRSLTRARSAAVRSLRESLYARGFLEVETPILQQVHGGANARPFITHSNAYDLDLYLRIAPELYLKKLCVGGMDKVFEIGRTFRNEGADWKHNPEFTILEAYEAHSDYDRMLDLCRELIQAAAMAAHGDQIALRPGPDGTLAPVDISGPWAIKTLHGAVGEALGEEIDPSTPLHRLTRLCDRAGIAYRPDADAGAVALSMYEHLVEKQTQAPTFYKDFPLSASPLTRSHRSTPGVAERWDLVAWGVELGTAYSELTDPVEQRRRLTEQSVLAAGGDPEAMELDEDFLTAMEYAMPPTGGLGMGVDRVVMLLTGRSIRETLPFPLARLR